MKCAGTYISGKSVLHSERYGTKERATVKESGETFLLPKAILKLFNFYSKFLEIEWKVYLLYIFNNLFIALYSVVRWWMNTVNSGKNQNSGLSFRRNEFHRRVVKSCKRTELCFIWTKRRSIFQRESNVTKLLTGKCLWKSKLLRCFQQMGKLEKDLLHHVTTILSRASAFARCGIFTRVVSTCNFEKRSFI